MRKKLIIELRSDLCAGNGKGFAQVIDVDTAVDAYGIPYIPGRRIKGCLRELAMDVLHEEKRNVEKLFGVSGNDRSGSLSVSDARIKDYDVQLDQIRYAINANKIKPNDITELFCSVRSATALEDETVKDNSLRFVRVVNRISPTDQKPLKFYADISFDDDDQETVSRLTKALRNIGYHRNRGLGYIKCSLEDAEDASSLQISPDYGISEEEPGVLTYLLYLESDLMLPASDANHSMDYIPGTSVLGALAGRYVKQFGEEGFQELFLSNQVRFSNVYVSDRDGTDYRPAPGFLAKIKAARKEEGTGIHNQVAEEQQNEDLRSRGEEIPQYKPLKKGYFNWEKGYKEPDTEIVYHNALNSEDSGLFTQYCISAGQFYKGKIEAPGRLLAKLEPLFHDGVLYFGRSKTAQYARCRIVSVDMNAVKSETVNLEAGNIAAFLCESDVVLIKDGRYTVQLEDLCKELENAAGIRIPTASLNKFTNITSGVVSGYNAKWNLKKPQFPVIRAGSVVLFHVDETKSDLADCYYIGEKQNEGFGRVRLLTNVKEMKVSEGSIGGTEPEGSPGELLAAVEAQKENDRILEAAMELALKISKASINASQLGRLTLMCKESSSYDDFKKRFDSIKTDTTREKAQGLFSREKLSEELKTDWKKQQKIYLKALTVSKYKLREGGENNV